MLRGNFDLKNLCFGFVIGIFIGFFAYAYISHKESASAAAGGALAPLPDIPAPVGWQADRTSSSAIIFSPDNQDQLPSRSLPDRIEVHALTMHGTLDQEIARDEERDPIPTGMASSTYIGWSGIPLSYEGGSGIPIGWATINGNLILVSNDRESDAGSAIDYTIYNNGIMYDFNLLPYQLYDPSAGKFVTVNPESLRTLQEMVQNFAERLPSGASR
jgi:hypothetical protein